MRVVRPTPWLAGKGLHCGGAARLRITPAAFGQGLVFERVDRGGATIPARLEHAENTERHTRLRRDGHQVATVEHALAALYGLQIDDATLQVEGDELPILDGSAGPIVAALTPCCEATEPREVRLEVGERFEYHDGSSSMCLEPPRLCGQAVIDCRIDFAHPAIGCQRLVLDLADRAEFCSAVAPARTFGLASDAAALRAHGLAGGADLDCVVVFDDRRALCDLRFADEPVRHKLLDALGDLALVGRFAGQLTLERPSHRLLREGLRQALAADVLRAR